MNDDRWWCNRCQKLLTKMDTVWGGNYRICKSCSTYPVDKIKPALIAAIEAEAVKREREAICERIDAYIMWLSREVDLRDPVDRHMVLPTAINMLADIRARGEGKQ